MDQSQPPCHASDDRANRAGTAAVPVAAQPAALAEFQGQPARLLVAVDLPGLFVLSLFAEFIANDRPILVSYKGEYLTPVFKTTPEEVLFPDDPSLPRIDFTTPSSRTRSPPTAG
jgi:hypothetical protein